jgi:serine/threonine protein kinase
MKAVMSMVTTVDVCYDESWNAFSEECRQFVRQLLNKNPKARLTAAQAMNHPWIVRNKTVPALSIIN